ncbi:MAG: pyridoxamine 5'-phosphate oxidase family protein [Methanosphaera sp.]|uniref:pyridoxamine 5'-phosphate oxidase family protein n=1 Tax=Methanosphaera sp. TaxID=2666342 RepID=UPI0025F3819E|nr:pyridoxamine 5'-phosphate oxidase family protein [Methanosphaera sp.]MCI5867788.1 pyridoxamine 5'-phosphate oxidase family protein [Methanosphaera sp.]MDD6535253.1 pyridoxamine 5'-phosphate oxidase family protein [Methanosphaera sp.]MDY3956414.1 pyridoxamine 5'-phosphate oxidase family protein [Methanosphaera sp.]
MNIPDLRNKKLEVTDIDEIKKFLNRATTIRVSFNSGEGYPITLPLSYGYEFTDDDKLIFYFHGGFNGVRYNKISEDGRVCIETDVFEKYHQAPPSATADYTSLVAFGDAVEVKDEEKEHAMREILKHCGYGYIDIDEKLFSVTSLFKVEVEKYTCKCKID